MASRAPPITARRAAPILCWPVGSRPREALTTIVPNPFSPIDRLDFDFDLPPLPSVLGRADRWFNRMNEIQRIGVVFLTLLLLAAAGLYCLGLGSTVLVNRAEAALAVEEARAAAAAPPTVEPLPTQAAATPTAMPTIRPTSPPTRAAAQPTRVVDLPTPIPAQLLPTIPLQPQAPQRAAAPVEQAPARPRLVAPVEPPTPTPPARTGAPFAPVATRAPVGGTVAPAATPVRGVTPAAKPGSVFTTPGPAPTSRPASTSAPAAKPTVGAPKPTAAPIFTNPIGNPTPTRSTTTR